MSGTQGAAPGQSPGQPQPAPQAQPTGRPQRPTEEQFDYDAERFGQALTQYEDNLVEWRLSQRERQQQQTQAVETFEQRRTETVTQGREKYEDFEEVVFGLPNTSMTEQVAAAIFETESPADVAYYLGKNPDEAAQIARMAPVQRAIRLGAIDHKLSTVGSARRTTGAPPPPPKLSGGGAPPLDVDKLAAQNPKEYIRLRNEGKI
jgi:hypothetical protein